MSNCQVICFGEILWDVFPNKKVIGGAPLNVALRLHSFQVPVKIISSLGNDEDGKAAQSYLAKQGLSIELIQKNEKLATGTVQVSLDPEGVASYEIIKPVAWDAIALTDTIEEIVQSSPFFIFGSLAVRGTFNHNILRRLLQLAPYRIFDVNLRPPHYDISMVYELMQLADFIKLNDDELEETCRKLGCREVDVRSQIEWLGKITNTNSICVTRGDAGAMLYVKEQFHEHSGFRVTVEDTVGAGDAFLATLIKGLLLDQRAAQNALEEACAVGALVASKAGANCEVTSSEVQSLIKSQL